MRYKIFGYIAFVFFASAFQIAFISGLPSGWNEINAILIIQVLILMFSGPRTAIYLSAAIGFFLDLFNFLPFGTNLIAFPLVCLLSNFMLANFLTNRSLYSFLAIIGAATVAYDLFLYAYVYIAGAIFHSEAVFSITGALIRYKFYGLIGNLLLIMLCFYVAHALSFRLQPSQLEKKYFFKK